MVERQLWRLGWAHRGLPIEAVLKDGVDRAVRSGADLEAAAARRLEPLDTVLAGQPRDAAASEQDLLRSRYASVREPYPGGASASEGRQLRLGNVTGPPRPPATRRRK